MWNWVFRAPDFTYRDVDIFTEPKSNPRPKINTDIPEDERFVPFSAADTLYMRTMRKARLSDFEIEDSPDVAIFVPIFHKERIVAIWATGAEHISVATEQSNWGRWRTQQLEPILQTYAEALTHWPLNECPPSKLISLALHATSPIRRMADLVNHAQLKAYLAGQALPFTVAQLEPIGAHLTQVQHEIKDANRTRYAARAYEWALNAAPDYLQALAVDDFAAAIEQACAHDTLTDALRLSIERKLEEDDLTSKMQHDLLFVAPAKAPWTDLQQAILGRLIEHARRSSLVGRRDLRRALVFWWPT